MGTKNLKGSVSIENITNRIRLRWRFQKKRYSLNLFHFTKSNLLQAKKIALQIENDIVSGAFDLTLEKYKPSALQEQIETRKSLVEHFQVWVKDYRNMDCERDIDYNSTRNMMLKWGDFDISTARKHFNKETFGASTYNRRLNLLKLFFNWAKNTKIVMENPFEDVLPRKIRKTEKSNKKPFTEDEIKKILFAFKNDTFSPTNVKWKHSHYFPFIYFIFKTGVRNAEAVGLRVASIDIDRNLIHIKEVLARTLKGTNAAARIRKETKNGKSRVIPLTEDLREILLPIIKSRKADDLVFISPTGKAIDDNQFQKRVFSKILKELKIEHRALYACRHTAISRFIQSGINPVTTAFLVGNNPQTALRNYTHLLNLPTDLPKVS
jgi:integrase